MQGQVAIEKLVGEIATLLSIKIKEPIYVLYAFLENRTYLGSRVILAGKSLSMNKPYKN